MIKNVTGLKQFYASVGRIVLVYGGGEWGRGKSGMEAYKAAGSPGKWQAYDCLDGTYLDSEGTLRWTLESIDEDGESQELAKAMFNSLGGEADKFFRKIGERM